MSLRVKRETLSMVLKEAAGDWLDLVRRSLFLDERAYFLNSLEGRRLQSPVSQVHDEVR